jgi:hypothetical protein
MAVNMLNMKTSISSEKDPLQETDSLKDLPIGRCTIFFF